jgi:hypothetical protein
MTEKDKAIELVSKYMMVDTHDEDHFIIRQQRGKKCALIAVDEMISVLTDLNGIYNITPALTYWQEVKQGLKNFTPNQNK